ncbi:CapA family protein [PVC group bacterium]|nr:CapA family protein [PVC group bacterium]
MKSDCLSILLVGDISLGGDLAESVVCNQTTWTSPFDPVLPLFRNADIRLGNLESPLSDGAFPCKKRNLVYAPCEAVKALTHLDFTALSLANNHITDQSDAGLEQTLELLKKHNIHAFGAGISREQAESWPRISMGGFSFVLLGYAVIGEDVGATSADVKCGGCIPFSLERAIVDVKAARKRNEQAIVSIHWGYQYDRYPSPDQVKTARLLIEAGALIVHGHHPHVIQGYERYLHGAILYSMGNFYFPDFRRSDHVKFKFPKCSKQTGVATCTVGAGGVENISFVPLEVRPNGQIQMLSSGLMAQALHEHEIRSKRIMFADYAKKWSCEHNKTVRWRCRHEARIALAAEILRLRNLMTTRNVFKIRHHHFARILSMCIKYVLLLSKMKAK